MGEHVANAGGRIADELQRLCCAETEGEFFDFVTEAVSTICHLLRERDDLLAKAAPQRDMQEVGG